MKTIIYFRHFGREFLELSSTSPLDGGIYCAVPSMSASCDDMVVLIAGLGCASSLVVVLVIMKICHVISVYQGDAPVDRQNLKPLS